MILASTSFLLDGEKTKKETAALIGLVSLAVLFRPHVGAGGTLLIGLLLRNIVPVNVGFSRRYRHTRSAQRKYATPIVAQEIMAVEPMLDLIVIRSNDQHVKRGLIVVDDTGGSKMNKIFIGLVVIAVILLILILIKGAVAEFGSQKDGGDGGDGGGSDGDKSDNSDIVAGGGGSNPTPPTTKKYVRKTTQEVITTSPTPDQFVPKPNPTLWPPPPAPGSQNDTVLCVVGENEITPVDKPVYPEDGLCNLVFFAHLVFLGNEFRGRRSEATWTNFRSAASKSSKTGYGFSIDYHDANTFYEAVFGSGSSTGIGQLKALKALATSWQATDTQIVIGVKFSSYIDDETFRAKVRALHDIVR
ncbi:hypothetical protein MTO96_015929 [Rhipicephalus appendiculatus]